MILRTAAVGSMIACLASLFIPFSAESAEKGKPAKGSASAAQPTVQKALPAAAPQLNAAIERIFLKGNRVFIALARTGSGKIASEDFPKIMLRIETSKGRQQWSLAEVDRARALGGGPGRMEFDTGIVLGKAETVRGVLSLGNIEKPHTARVSGGAARPADELPPISRSSASPSVTPTVAPVSGATTAVATLPAFITIHRPRSGQANTPGATMHVDYQLSRHAAEGPIQFTLYRAGEEPQATGGSGPQVRRPAEPALMFTANYRPGPAGTPEPIHMLTRTLPRNLAVGQYCLIARHAEAVGKSSYFDVTFEMGSEGTVECDYGIETATYTDGYSLGSYALNVTSGSSVRGTFRVHIRWNGAHAPSGYPASGAAPYAISVRSSTTGTQIGRQTFRYRTDRTFTVDVNFEFARDSIPGMTRMGVIPLEFRLEKTSGESIDSNPDNNLLAANIAVNAVETNMEIGLRDFSLTRTPHMKPRKDEYHLTQEYRVRNLSTGTANVKIKACVYRRDAGETWDHAFSHGCSTLTNQPIGAGWTNKTFSLTFRDQDPWDIPSDSRFRVVIEVDPDHVLIDSNRANNTGVHTFRITEGPPGAGSGTVVGD